MAEVTERDRAVWSAYVGTALALDPSVHDLGAKVLKSLADAQAGIDSGKSSLTAISKACEDGVKACDLEEGTHPSITSKVQVVRRNLQAVVDQVGGGKSVRADSKPADDTPSDDGKVDCPCGKRHAAGSKVLERHQAKG